MSSLEERGIERTTPRRMISRRHELGSHLLGVQDNTERVVELVVPGRKMVDRLVVRPVNLVLPSLQISFELLYVVVVLLVEDVAK